MLAKIVDLGELSVILRKDLKVCNEYLVPGMMKEWITEQN